MTAIDEYLEGVEGWHREMLISWRDELRKQLPTAEESIYYGVPCFKVDGDALAGFAAYKKHCAYFPFSGQTLKTLEPHLDGFTRTQGALHVKEHQVLTSKMVKELLAARKLEIEQGYGHRKKK